jgi:hypothetical protein
MDNFEDIDVFAGEEDNEDLSFENINSDQLPVEMQEIEVALPDIKTRSYVDYTYLKELTNDDFDLDSYTLIDLKRKDKKGELINDGNWFILFMDESKTGKMYLQRILELAQILKNDYAQIAYVNMTFERKIFKNFRELSNIAQINNPMNWAKITNIPFMLVYRDRWASGFFNRELNQENLADFIINKASNALEILDKTEQKVNNFKNQIRESEKNIERINLLNRAKEDDIKEKEKIKEINPRTQQISEGINFLE